MDDNVSFIKENQTVILSSRDNKFYFVKTEPKSRLKIGKNKRFSVEALIGAQWGDFFRQAGGNLEKCQSIPEESSSDLKNKSDDDATKGEFEEEKEENSVQKLSTEDIEKMKSEGVESNEIIKALMKNSATFQEKTEFSKQKYIKRKENKYAQVFQAINPTASTLCQAYYRVWPAKIGNLRYDTLSQMLALANVQASSRVVVCDTCAGLLIGAVTERLNDGKVINVHHGSNPSLKVLEHFNFDLEKRKSISHIQFHELPSFDEGCPSQDSTTEKEEIQKMLLEQVDSLLIASKYEPSSTFFALYPYLAPGRSFSIFCEYSQPLAECYYRLLKENVALNLDLSEIWLRHYQVLPYRTHPLMRMSAASGFILTGIKVEPGEQSSEPPAKKRKS